MTHRVAIVGGGPAGLMAAEVLSAAEPAFTASGRIDPRSIYPYRQEPSR